MKLAEIWGNCPFRRSGWATSEGFCVGWTYICGKNGGPCDPNYCLGPDENEKEIKNEQ